MQLLIFIAVLIAVLCSYQLMLSCWEYDAEKRPTFEASVSKLESISSVSNQSEDDSYLNIESDDGKKTEQNNDAHLEELGESRGYVNEVKYQNEAFEDEQNRVVLDTKEENGEMHNAYVNQTGKGEIGQHPIFLVT